MTKIFQLQAHSRRPATVMDMAVAAMDLMEGRESVYQRATVHGPLPPGAENSSQGGVGQDDQRLGRVQAGQDAGQPTMLGLSQGEGRAGLGVLPPGVQAQEIDALAVVHKAALAKNSPTGLAFCWAAVPFAMHRQHRHGKL